MKSIGAKTLIKTDKWSYVRRFLETDAGDSIERDYVDHPGSVVIVPRFDDDRYLIEKIHRLSLDRTCREFPAGTREPGEPALLTAIRELKEETGYDAERWTELFSYFPAPGLTNERMTVFLAEVLTPGRPSAEVDERIELEILTWSDLIGLIDSGVIDDGKTMLAATYLSRRRV
jgi:ADP-ribose pyrophosphatase